MTVLEAVHVFIDDTSYGYLLETFKHSPQIKGLGLSAQKILT